MSANSRVVKITAKATLKNRFVSSVFSALSLIFCCFIGVFSTSYISLVVGDIVSTVLLLLYSFFLSVPLFFGVLRFFWRMLFSSNDNPVSVFYYFSEKTIYLKCLKLTLKLVLKAIIPAIILFIPVFGLWLVSKGSIFEMINVSIPLWTANLTYIFIFVRTLAIILLVIHMFKYYLAPLFFIADENMDLDEVMHMSTVISKKSSIDFSYLIFSFSGWIILSLLVIPLVFTLPYFFSAYTVHFRFAVAEYNKHVEETVNNDFSFFAAGN